MLPYLIFR